MNQTITRKNEILLDKTHPEVQKSDHRYVYEALIDYLAADTHASWDYFRALLEFGYQDYRLNDVKIKATFMEQVKRWKVIAKKLLDESIQLEQEQIDMKVEKKEPERKQPVVEPPRRPEPPPLAEPPQPPERKVEIKRECEQPELKAVQNVTEERGTDVTLNQRATMWTVAILLTFMFAANSVGHDVSRLSELKEVTLPDIDTLKEIENLKQKADDLTMCQKEYPKHEAELCFLRCEAVKPNPPTKTCYKETPNHEAELCKKICEAINSYQLPIEQTYQQQLESIHTNISNIRRDASLVKRCPSPGSFIGTAEEHADQDSYFCRVKQLVVKHFDLTELVVPEMYEMLVVVCNLTPLLGLRYFYDLKLKAFTREFIYLSLITIFTHASVKMLAWFTVPNGAPIEPGWIAKMVADQAMEYIKQKGL